MSTSSGTARRFRRRGDDPHEILRNAGLTMSVPDAGVLFGLGEAAARAMARRGEFPVKTLRVGRQWRVPTADVRRALGLPVEPVEPVAGASA